MPWSTSFCCLLLHYSLTGALSLSGGASSSVLPSWKEIQSSLPSVKHTRPLVLDAAVDNIDESSLTADGKTILYIDRNCWDPNAQRAWLALEVKGAKYVTVLEGADYSNPITSLPRLRWTDGTVQGGSDMYDILEKIQNEYPDGPDLYPQGISISVDIVRASIERRFDGIMPRYTRPSSLAPYVFREEDGTVVPKFKFNVCMEEIDEVLEEYDDGPFIAGTDITAADIFWAPFLERFAAQLPLLYDGLKPRSNSYEAVMEWYDAMDQYIPCYSCRVKGRVETWQSVLATTHPELEVKKRVGNAGVPNLPTKKSFDANKVWMEYVKDKPYLAETPAKEVAAQLFLKREELIELVTIECPSVGNPDGSFRELCNVLSHLDVFDPDDAPKAASSLSGDARDVASFLISDDGLSVPRDIGVIPAEALKGLTGVAPAPRIA